MPPKGYKKNFPIREKVLSFRVTKEEFAILSIRIEASGLNVQNFLRKIVFGGTSENILHER